MDAFCKSLKPKKAASSCMQLWLCQATTCLLVYIYICMIKLLQGALAIRWQGPGTEVGHCGAEHARRGPAEAEDPRCRPLLCLEPLGPKTAPAHSLTTGIRGQVTTATPRLSLLPCAGLELGLGAAQAGRRHGSRHCLPHSRRLRLLRHPDFGIKRMRQILQTGQAKDDQYRPVHINAAVPDPKGRLRFGPPRLGLGSSILKFETSAGAGMCRMHGLKGSWRAGS